MPRKPHPAEPWFGNRPSSVGGQVGVRCCEQRPRACWPPETLGSNGAAARGLQVLDGPCRSRLACGPRAVVLASAGRAGHPVFEKTHHTARPPARGVGDGWQPAPRLRDPRFVSSTDRLMLAGFPPSLISEGGEGRRVARLVWTPHAARAPWPQLGRGGISGPRDQVSRRPGANHVMGNKVDQPLAPIAADRRRGDWKRPVPHPSWAVCGSLAWSRPPHARSRLHRRRIPGMGGVSAPSSTRGHQPASGLYAAVRVALQPE